MLKPGGVSATAYMPRGKNPSRENGLDMAGKVKGHMEAVGFAKIRIEEPPMEPTPAVCVLGEHP